MKSLWNRRRTDVTLTEATEEIRALVVDDDPSYVRYMARLLRKLGISVTTAFDGIQALEALGDGAIFELMLIDLNMPRLDGFGLVERIRRDEDHKSSYLIMLTASEDVATKIEALARGYDDYITKCSSEIEILAKVVASRRIVVRQQTLDQTLHAYYGLATRDELTGIFNRRFFFEEAQKAFQNPCVNLSLVMFDLDNFKQINDGYGHLVGDRVLGDVGALFSRFTRQEDLIARYGGDEFIMLVCELPFTEVEMLVKRVEDRLSELHWTVEGALVRTQVTSGIASLEFFAGADLKQLLAVCDQDLYKNKWIKKHPVSVAPPEPLERGEDTVPIRMDRIKA